MAQEENIKAGILMWQSWNQEERQNHASAFLRGTTMTWLCLCHLSFFFFFPHSGGKPALIVRWVIVNNMRMFHAYSVTPCQANKSLAFALTVFICSIFYPWVNSILGTRKLRWLFTSKMCCVCPHKAHRAQRELQEVSHSHPCSDDRSCLGGKRTLHFLSSHWHIFHLR